MHSSTESRMAMSEELQLLFHFIFVQSQQTPRVKFPEKLLCSQVIQLFCTQQIHMLFIPEVLLCHYKMSSVMITVLCKCWTPSTVVLIHPSLWPCKNKWDPGYTQAQRSLSLTDFGDTRTAGLCTYAGCNTVPSEVSSDRLLRFLQLKARQTTALYLEQESSL